MSFDDERRRTLNTLMMLYAMAPAKDVAAEDAAQRKREADAVMRRIAFRFALTFLFLAALIALLWGSAHAQQTTVYGPDGRVRERITTDSQGSRTIYDAGGRVSGRTATDRQGTITIYDASGNRAGTITGGKR
jgi:YD repeat-containing protein